jgi:hypothetical protein
MKPLSESLGWTRRLSRQNGRLKLMMFCVVVSTMMGTDPGRFVSELAVFATRPSGFVFLQLDELRRVLIFLLILSAGFTTLWVFTILSYPRGRAAIEYAAAGFVVNALVVRFLPGADGIIHSYAGLATLGAVLALHWAVRRSGLSARPLPWHQTCRHSLFLPLPPEALRSRLIPQPQQPGLLADPAIASIGAPDETGFMQLEYRYSDRTEAEFVRVEEDVQINVFTLVRRHGASGAPGTHESRETLRLCPHAQGTMLVASLIRRPSPAGLVAHFLDDSYADGWDRMEALILGRRDWSVAGALKPLTGGLSRRAATLDGFAVSNPGHKPTK